MIDKVQWYSDAFQNLPEAFFIVDDAGAVLFANAACERLIGRSAPDVQGKAVVDFLQFSADATTGDQNLCPGRALLLHGGAAATSVRVSVQPVPDPDGGAGLRICLIQPVAGQGGAARSGDEAARLVGEQDAPVAPGQGARNAYQVAFRNAPVKLLIVDWEGLIVDTTDLFLRHFGYGRHEVAGRPFAQFVPMEMHAAADAALDPGEVLFARASTVPLAISDRQGDSVKVELEISRQSDRQLRVLVVDVEEAEAVRTELERRNAELELANENLQNFASIASHDMQEPLRKIRYFSEMLRCALAEGNAEDVEYALNVLGDASGRASRLVSDLLTFSRSTNDDLVREPIDLPLLLRDLVSDLSQGDLVGDADIRMDIPPCQISGDPTSVSQLFRNLIGNALKYRSSDRRLSLRIEAEIAGPPFSRLRVKVADNGIGFEPQYAETIFQPFRRLHRRQVIPGNGIGLAICDIVARRHDWRLTAEGRLDKGAVFTVEIPGVAQQSAAAQ